MTEALQLLLDAANARQDYLWFMAAAGWITVATLVCWLARPELSRALRVWMLFAAAAGVIAAGLELWLGVNPPSAGLGSNRAWIDAVLVLQSILALAALAWVSAPTRNSPGRLWRIACGLLLALAAGARLWAPFAARTLYHGNVFERGPAPFLAAATLAVVQCAIIALAARGLRLTGWDGTVPAGVRGGLRWVLGLIAMTCVGSTFGPIAEYLGWARRWGFVGVSPLGASSAILHLLLAFSFVFVCWRWSATAIRRNPTWPRERRWLLWAVAIWVAFGLILAEWASIGARNRFETGLVTQARLAALGFSVDELETCLGSGLQLEKPVLLRQATGQPVRAFESAFAATPAFEGPRRTLARIAEQGGGVSPSIATLRDGLLVTAIIPPQPGLRAGLVAASAASPGDLASWNERRSMLVRPGGLSGNLLLTARVPLSGSGGKMLGWLNLRVSAAQWAASQAQARLLTFAVVALGLVLASLLAMHRWRALQHEDARRLAMEADAATRAKTDFLAKVSHELRTPAQSILGYAQLMENSGLNGSQQTWLRALQSQTELMVRLVADLLDLSAMQLGTFRLLREPTPLPALIADAVATLRHAADRKGLELGCTIDAAVPPSILGDGTRIRQVLLNLISNAVKFTASGRVDVQVRVLRNLPAPPDLSWCEVSVSDTGPGISVEEQVRLFQPFTRLASARNTEGSGLGLSVSAALVRAMGGVILVESDGSSGTTFRVRWPWRAAGEEPSSRDSNAGPDLSGRRLLVADDNQLIRELLETYLTSLGAMVVGAADGESALRYSLDEDFDVIVLDLSLPGANGLTVARQIRARNAARPPRIIILSAHADSTLRAQAAGIGIDAFFTKPASLRALAAAALGVPDSGAAAASDLPLELARKFVEQFSAEFPRQFAELRDALDRGEWSRVRASAHTLAGSAAMLRWDELRTVCLELEVLAAPETALRAQQCCERLRVLGYAFVSPIVNRPPTQSPSSHVHDSTRQADRL